MAPRNKDPQHYVNNKQFLEALSEFKHSVQKAKAEGLPRPRITRYIGECFLKIATHLSYKPNFVNYMFREDMISDGVENCVQYIDNFDPNRGNPFAYFTQIIWYAFLRRIEREKRQLDLKSKILEQSGFDEVFVSDRNILDGNESEYNGIKNSVHCKMLYN
jgi:DNA-directed RNA polymerase specialized sigma subunit